MIRFALPLAAALACAGSLASAADAPKTTTADIKNAGGASIGSARVTEAPNGVLLHLELKGLTPGWHGLTARPRTSPPPGATSTPSRA